MYPATFAPLATAVLGLPAALLAALPPWTLLTLTASLRCDVSLPAGAR
jgi:hypothetical protein